MRRPVQIQLLLPTLTVVVLAIVLASGASAYWGRCGLGRAQEASSRGVVATLSEAKFPLSQPVLRQMSGLSGAEFIFLDETPPRSGGHAADGCGGPPAAEQWPSGHWPPTAAGATPAGIELAGRTYLAERVPISGRARTPAGSLVVLYSEDLWSAAMRQAAYPALAGRRHCGRGGGPGQTVLPSGSCGRSAGWATDGRHRPGRLHARGRRPRDDEIRDLAARHQPHDRAAQPVRARSPPQRAAPHAGATGAGMAHQLRNAATGGRMAVELHQRECPAAAGSESLEVALRQLRLMESYLQRFLTLGRPRPACRETVSLERAGRRRCRLVRPACLHAGIELSVGKPREPLAVRATPRSSANWPSTSS